MDITVIQEVKDELNKHIPHGYQIKCMIGEGSMSTIYTITNPQTNLFLAVKAISSFENDRLRLKMLQEFNIHHELNHPNIIAVFGFKDTEFYTLIYMELLTGGDLFDLIPVGEGININRGYQIFKEVLSAVEYCHSKNIVHMDIKPENIMISGSGHAKLIDFGIAVDHSQRRFIHGHLGTVAYSAPETFTSFDYAGYKADLFSLNVTFLTVITGERCWSSARLNDPHYLDWYKRQWTLDVFKRLPTDLLDFLVLALAHDACERLSIKQIRSHSWFLNGAKNAIKAVMTTPKKTSDKDVPKSQPLLTKFEGELHCHEIPLSQPIDLGSILMPEVNDREQIVKRMSRFFSNKGICETVSILCSVVDQHRHCNITNSAPNCVTVECSWSGFGVQFRIFVYKFGDSILVDFRRIKGDGLLFRNLFVDIKEALTEVGCVSDYCDGLKRIQPSG